MKLLLTSAGLTNPSIAEGLKELTGTEPQDTKVAYIPVAADALAGNKTWLLRHYDRLREYGYAFDMVNISGLTPRVTQRRLEAADVIVGGAGHPHYMSYWMDKSGMFDALPELLQKRVYVGISAGSMIVGQSLILSTQALPRIDRLSDGELATMGPEERSSAKTAKLVDFLIRPHLNSSEFPKINEERIEVAAKKVSLPIYAIDDQTAISVIGGVVKIISEGNYRVYNESVTQGMQSE